MVETKEKTMSNNEDSGCDNGSLSDSSITSCGLDNLTVRKDFYDETKLENSTSLSIYNISGYDITTLSQRTFQYLPSFIRVINLSSNKIFCLPDTLSTLNNIEELDVSKNSLSDLPECFKRLNKLRILNLSSNNLTKLPLCLEIGMKNVTTLNLSHNKIVELTNEPQCLPVLQTLYISKNNVMALPMWLFGEKCRSLNHLDCSFNFCFDYKDLALKIQPLKHHRISALKSLKVFNISNTGITKDMIDFLADFESLEDLQMGNWEKQNSTLNHLRDIPFECFSNPTRIEKLNVANLGIVNISDDLTKLKNLKILNLSDNTLDWLPECFGSLHSLEELILSNCSLACLPDSFKNLLKLKTLRLDHNKLCEVWLKEFMKLEWLDLYDNFLEEFPLTMDQMCALKKLDLASNYFDVQETLEEREDGAELYEIYMQLQNNLRNEDKSCTIRGTSQKERSSSLHYDSQDSLYKHYTSDEEGSYQGEITYQTYLPKHEEDENWEIDEDQYFDPNSIHRYALVPGKYEFGYTPPLKKIYSDGHPEYSVPFTQQATGFIFVPGDAHLKLNKKRRHLDKLPTEEGQFCDIEVNPVLPENQDIISDRRRKLMFVRNTSGPTQIKCKFCTDGEDCYHPGIWIRF